MRSTPHQMGAVVRRRGLTLETLAADTEVMPGTVGLADQHLESGK